MNSQHIQDIAESTRIYENLNRFDEILLANELSLADEELIYKSKLINLQQSMFNKRLASGNNRCSSYLTENGTRCSVRSDYVNVETNGQYEDMVDLSQAIDAEIMREISSGGEEEVHGQKSTNLKKQLRNLIAKKFKKFHQIMNINLASSKENVSVTKTVQAKKSRKSWLPTHVESKTENHYQMSPVAMDTNKCQARLVNFNYKSSFFNDQLLPVKTPVSASVASKRRPTRSNNSSSSSESPVAVVASQSAKDKTKRMKISNGIYANETGLTSLTPIASKRFPAYLLEDASMAVDQHRRILNSTEKNIYQSIMQFNSNLSKVTRSARINNCHNSDGESGSSASSSASSSTSSLASCATKKSFFLEAPCSIRFDKTRSQMARSIVLGKSATINASCKQQDTFKASTLQFDQSEMSTSTPVVTRKTLKTPPAVKDFSDSSLNLSDISTKSEKCCKSCSKCPPTSSNQLSQNDDDEEIYEQETCDNAAIGFASQMMDQSTQALTESPVLLESTFDTSSVSNLSDDLIILQTATVPARPSAPSAKKSAITEFKKPVDGFVCSSTLKRPEQLQFKSSFQNSSFQRATTSRKEEPQDWNIMVINKFHENTNCTLDAIPEWAQGTNLNIALVNQAYFNPNANGVFNRL